MYHFLFYFKEKQRVCTGLRPHPKPSPTESSHSESITTTKPANLDVVLILSPLLHLPYRTPKPVNFTFCLLNSSLFLYPHCHSFSSSFLLQNCNNFELVMSLPCLKSMAFHLQMKLRKTLWSGPLLECQTCLPQNSVTHLMLQSQGASLKSFTVPCSLIVGPTHSLLLLYVNVS